MTTPRKKRYCEMCDRWFPLRTSECPACGMPLVTSELTKFSDDGSNAVVNAATSGLHSRGKPGTYKPDTASRHTQRPVVTDSRPSTEATGR